MDTRPPIALTVTLDGHPTSSATTRLGHTGAYIVELSTVLPDLPVDVHSVYVGHPRADTRVVHLLLGPEHIAPTTEVLCPPPDVLPVLWARSRCLLDHAARLLAWLEELGNQARIDIPDAALAQLDTIPAPAG